MKFNFRRDMILREMQPAPSSTQDHLYFSLSLMCSYTGLAGLGEVERDTSPIAREMSLQLVSIG